MAELNPELASVVQTVQDHHPGFVEVTHGAPVSVSVKPNPEACPMYIIDLGTAFVFGVGRGSCRWELEFKPDDLGFARKVWDAVVAGQVSEVFGPGRSRLQVGLLDGTTTQTGATDFPRGCLPIPRWRQNRKRTIDYSEYRG